LAIKDGEDALDFHPIFLRDQSILFSDHKPKDVFIFISTRFQQAHPTTKMATPVASFGTKSEFVEALAAALLPEIEGKATFIPCSLVKPRTSS
jgi:hypothetical protein